jgi:hypothetical protein
MPHAAIRRGQEAGDDSAASSPVKDATSIHLYLPSAVKQRAGCTTQLRDYEFRLRQAQAFDALNEIRQGLRLRSQLWKFKTSFERGQRPNTRARGVIERCNHKIKLAAAKYHAAYSALRSLDKYVDVVGWDIQLRKLEDKDIREMSEDVRDMDPKERKKLENIEKKRKRDQRPSLVLSEGRKEISWIWKTWGVAADTDDSLHDGELSIICSFFALGGDIDFPRISGLRIEWCRARARAMRWSEEVQLLQEEMRRVLAFFSWKADWWASQLGLRGSIEEGLSEGLDAYTHRQADIWRTLHLHCAHLWRHTDEYIRTGAFTDLADQTTDRSTSQADDDNDDIDPGDDDDLES